MRPGTGGVDHHPRADLQRRVSDEVAAAHAHDAIALAQEVRDLDVVRRPRAAFHRRLEDGEPQARRVVHLAVVEEPRTGEPLGVEPREAVHALVAGQEAPPGNAARGVVDAAVPVEGEQVVGQEGRPQEALPLEALGVSGDGDGQRVREMWRGAQQGPPVAARLADASEVHVLQIADAAVDHLEGMRRGGTAEVAALHKGHGQAPKRRVPGNVEAEDPSADHRQVVSCLDQVWKSSIHPSPRREGERSRLQPRGT